MRPASHDLCFLYTPRYSDLTKEKKPIGATCLQTDDTASIGNKKFMALEEQQCKFKSKQVDVLSDGKTISFNGAQITKEGDAYILFQKDHINRMQPLDTKNLSADDYVSQRARGGYIASTCRPDLMFGFSYAAQFPDPTEENFKFLNKVIGKALSTPSKGLRFIPLDSETIVVGVFIDASFACNPGLSSQLGYLITLRDERGVTNVIHYGSVKSKRVTRSVLAAELYAMILGFDVSAVIQRTITDFLGKHVPLHLYTDSKSLYDSLTTLNATSEKRLLIDLALLRESYETREIDAVYWIPGTQNPADSLTKWNACGALNSLLEQNILNVSPNAWIERPRPKWAKADSNN